jgi:trehalose-6-phosphate synthase
MPTAVQAGDRQVAVGVFPVGVDVDQLDQRRQHPRVRAKVAALQELYAGKKARPRHNFTMHTRTRTSTCTRTLTTQRGDGQGQVVLGRDKMDYIRGLPHKLRAFECLLRDYPGWRDSVVLVQVAVPAPAAAGAADDGSGGATPTGPDLVSTAATTTNNNNGRRRGSSAGSTPWAAARAASADPRRLELQVADHVARINSQYGSLAFTPVQLVQVRTLLRLRAHMRALALKGRGWRCRQRIGWTSTR